MEHYITQINIDKLRHLSNIAISLNAEKRQHLIITGKNGSGKTSVLTALQKYLQAINDGNYNYLVEVEIPKWPEIEERLSKAQTETEKYEIEKANQFTLQDKKNMRMECGFHLTIASTWSLYILRETL